VTSKRHEIQAALVTRLQSITTANGYPVEIAKVVCDAIPMGLDLQAHDLPAIFVLDEGAENQHEMQVLDVAWGFRLQLIETSADDERVSLIIRSVLKALYADSSSAQRTDAFRFHPSVTWVELLDVDSDLHMIEANRMAAITLIVHYRTTAWDY